MMGTFGHKVTLGFTIRNAVRITIGASSATDLRFWEGPSQVRFSQIQTHQICPAQIGPDQLSPARVRIGQIGVRHYHYSM